MPKDDENPFSDLEGLIKFARGFFAQPSAGSGDVWSQVSDLLKKPAAAPKDTPADAAAARDKLLFGELAKMNESLGDILLELKALRQAVSRGPAESPGRSTPSLNWDGTPHGPRVQPGGAPRSTSAPDADGLWDGPRSS